MEPGKAVLVTGSTSGIGQATARMFLSRGNDVIVTGIADQQTIDDVMKEFKTLPGKAIFVPVDLRDVNSIQAFCEEVDKLYPNGIDVLVNNAGAIFNGPVDEIPKDKWNEVIAVNLSAPFHLIKHFLPAMRRKVTDKLFQEYAEKWGIPVLEAKERFIREGHPTGKATEISHITDYIWFLCSPGADNMTGTAVPLDGGNTSR